ncbi:MAG TPA: radical SAM protein, partial [Minicystis sp.]|nr:radical SAM protein [Minicystis sp.]
LEYVAVARAIPGIEHVRVQTNAVRLADEGFARALVDAGVDEVFVSLHAPDAASCDAITGRVGSFERILAGMRAARRAGAALVTNTVMVRQNCARLADVVELALDHGPASVELWGYWPRVHERADEFVVPVAELRAPLVEAMRRAVARGVPPVVRWFPRCLLPPDLEPHHDDGQPRMLVEPRFWDREPRFACIYAGVCDEHGAQRCSGLSAAYVERCGWEEDVLRPRRVARQDDDRARADPMLRSLLCDEGPRRTRTARAARWLSARAMPFGASIEGFSLATLERGRFGDRVRLAFERAGETAHVLVARRGERLVASAERRGAEGAAALVRAVQARLDGAPDGTLP